MTRRKAAAPAKINEAPQALLHVREIAVAKEKALGQKRPATIFFTDLCDSTPYKLARGQINGLVKSYLHNDLATRAVEKFHGEVVKYIGAEVMAVFAGDSDGCKAAVDAA